MLLLPCKLYSPSNIAFQKSLLKTAGKARIGKLWFVLFRIPCLLPSASYLSSKVIFVSNFGYSNAGKLSSLFPPSSRTFPFLAKFGEMPLKSRSQRLVGRLIWRGEEREFRATASKMVRRAEIRILLSVCLPGRLGPASQIQNLSLRTTKDRQDTTVWEKKEMASWGEERKWQTDSDSLPGSRFRWERSKCSYGLKSHVRFGAKYNFKEGFAFNVDFLRLLE